MTAMFFCRSPTWRSPRTSSSPPTSQIGNDTALRQLGTSGLASEAQDLDHAEHPHDVLHGHGGTERVHGVGRRTTWGHVVEDDADQGDGAQGGHEATDVDDPGGAAQTGGWVEGPRQVEPDHRARPARGEADPEAVSY